MDNGQVTKINFLKPFPIIRWHHNPRKPSHKNLGRVYINANWMHPIGMTSQWSQITQVQFAFQKCPVHELVNRNAPDPMLCSCAYVNPTLAWLKYQVPKLHFQKRLLGLNISENVKKEAI